MERVLLKIHGKVQGVFFRATTRNEASKLGLCGSVKNTHDGCVEVIAEGKRESLETLIKWCNEGPSLARVDQVEIFWEKASGNLSSFQITH
ncbi:MAG: acylphosphatase [Deltaproteobacteria bacterium]|jgi:acylphosphatase|nr:acylphosphatase [Deltaproteobacteria bacterium]